MKHSLKIHVKQCKELYKKWDGFKSMPTALNSELLHSDKDHILQKRVEIMSQAIPDRAIRPGMNIYETINGIQLSEYTEAIELDRYSCPTCSRKFCSESLQR